jgi:AP-2 complex subunit mu-1
MIGTIFVLTLKGGVILSRTYRPEDVNKSIATAFRTNIIATKEVRSPVVLFSNHSFAYIREDDIFLAAVSVYNTDVSAMFEILYAIRDVLKAYLGGKLNENTIKNHLILALELLEEMMDYGYPQNCSLDAIKPFITQKGKTIKPEKLGQEQLNKIIIQATGSVPWRKGTERYKKNEIYMDVKEAVNVLVSVDGKILRCDVAGSIMMKVYLSGLPECKFGINDKILMEKEKKASTDGRKPRSEAIVIDDVTFHQCVRLGKFDSDRSITFVPPDGEFELMKYRTTENINLPFKLFPSVKEISKTRLDIHVSIKSTFKEGIDGQNVKVKIPVPKNTAVVECIVQKGRAKYYPEEEAVIWKIKKFPGNSEYQLQANVQLSATVKVAEKAWSRPPISVDFQVPMTTASGFTVRYLRVIEAKLQYEATKWVRYLTTAGNYQYRI